MKLLKFITIMLTSIVASAQVDIDRPVNFTNQNPDERQLLHVGQPIHPHDGVPLEAFRNGTVTNGIATGHNVIEVDLFPDVQAYVNGLMLTFVAAQPNTDTVYVNVDGLGDVLVLRSDALPLDPEDILTGQIVILTYLNGQFVMRSRSSSRCPSNTVKVNESYCIDLDESAQANFYDASKNCNDRGGRLCKWDEHFYACQRTDLGLLSMADNWEWIDDTSDHTHTADQVNRWSCYSQRSAEGTIVTYSPYRCCFTIR